MSAEKKLQEILNDVHDETNHALNVGLEVENVDLDVEGNVAHDAVDLGNPMKVGGRAVSSQIAAVASEDRTDQIYNLYGEQVLAGFDWASDKLGISESDPLSSHHVEDTIIDATNITTNTTTYAYVDMDGGSGLSLQGETSGATPTDVLTVTIEGTNQDDGTAPASCAYQDISAICYDLATNALGASNWVDTDFWVWLTPAVAGLFKYVRVKYVTSNDAGGDCDLTVYSKKAYI